MGWLEVLFGAIASAVTGVLVVTCIKVCIDIIEGKPSSDKHEDPGF